MDMDEQPLHLEVLNIFRMPDRSDGGRRFAVIAQVLAGTPRVGRQLVSEDTSDNWRIGGVEMFGPPLPGKEEWVREQEQRGIRGLLLEPMTSDRELQVGEHLVAEPGNASPIRE
jgi:hypothetical protein